MNFPGSKLQLSNIDLRTPPDQSARAAGLVNLGTTFSTFRNNDADVGAILNNKITLNAQSEALRSALKTDLEIQDMRNEANLEIFKDSLKAQRSAAQEKAQKAKGGFFGQLGGAAAGAGLLAAGVVGPLAIPIGMAAGGSLFG